MSDHTSQKLEALFNDLNKKAYHSYAHNYHYKEANQVIREHVEKLESREKDLEQSLLYCIERLSEAEVTMNKEKWEKISELLYKPNKENG
jgi:exonuclease VII small subunit